MPILQPQTPPPTAPASPSNATSSDGNFVINISGDPEKDGYKEDDKNDDRGPIDPNADVKESFRGRVKTYLKSAGNLSSIRQIPQRWRREDGRPKILQRIDDHPEGYPQLAAFINSDDNFLMCRKFGFLHNRVLLYRQDELVELERDLVEMDELDKDEDPRALKSRQHDNGRDLPLTRKTLINRIDEKLKEYDGLVQRIRASVALPSPSARNYNSFYTWIDDEQPLTASDREFVKHSYDFAALAEKQEGGWFDGVIEDAMSILPRWFTKALLASAEQRKKSDDKYVHLYSKYRIDVLARLLLTIVSVVLLMAPSAVLFLMDGHGILKVLIIMIFTLLFSAALSVFTKAKRHEMFAATAA